MENGTVPKAKEGTKGEMVWYKHHRRTQEGNNKRRGITRRK